MQGCGFEPMQLEIGIERAVPLERCLLESVETLVQATDMVWPLGVDKALQLVYIVLFGECCIQECSGDVHLVDFVGE